ncbi:hypothetical protein JG688_00008030 [Phytophthora aleatoria]|uniref:Uncharacterized protein n=1 Tax=Phytophthora aleatoria TaxID=2496075 RepID=A0A8J5M4X6_9STRA|nr:hypothetical protein JG688_00008030 [Phytophthora aleatoria]
MSSTKTTSDASAETIQSTQTDNENLVARVASIVELKRRQNQEELPTIGARVANTKFWVKMRDILLVNKASVGADQLDDAVEAFNGVITLLSADQPSFVLSSRLRRDDARRRTRGHGDT